MKQHKNRKFVFKYFPRWEYERTERWLNEMSLQGWALAWSIVWLYRFERTEPGEYIFRMQFHKKNVDYVKFVEEMGAESLGSNGTAYTIFRRKSALGDFDLLQDLDARIEHLSRMERSFLSGAIWDSIANVYMIYLMVSSGLRVHEPVSHIAFFACIYILLILINVYWVYGAGCIHGKRSELEKERQLHE